MGRVYGYNRVSTREQHLDRGTTAIQEFCEKNGYDLIKVFEDKQTGKQFDRPRYVVLKEDILISGDTLIVPEYDRLGRANETKQELEYFKSAGIRVIFLDIPTTQIDFSSLQDEMVIAIMNCVNDTLISFYDLLARTELERQKKRQREGIQAKKERGEWADYGRPRCMSREAFKAAYERVRRGEIGSLSLMRELGLHKDTYFRYVREAKNSKFD